MIDGFYINLDSSRERASQIKKQLKTLGLERVFHRFAAVDGHKYTSQCSQFRLTPGEIGVWMSHVNVIRRNLKTRNHLHIIEDDALLARNLPAFYSRIENHQIPEDWDLIFTSIGNVEHVFADLYRLARHAGNAGQIYMQSLSNVRFSSALSYIVRSEKKEKLYDLINEGWKSGIPIDLYYRELVQQGKLNAYVTVPFLSTPDLSFDSTIQEPSASLQLFRIVNSLFYIEADLEKLHEQAKQYTQDIARDPVLDVFLELQKFRASGRFEIF